MKPKAIIVDIDGTFTNNDHRQHYIAGEKKDWKSFSENCGGDTINEWCAELTAAMDYNFQVIFVSGRCEQYREITEHYIDHGAGVMEIILYMRKDGDYRDDTIIKEEIYNEHIRDKYDVLFCIDDRPRVCRMWRSLGLTVLQCNDKEF